MKRFIGLATVAALLVGGAATLPAQAAAPTAAVKADKRKCVTDDELRALTPGMKRSTAVKLLDGNGKRVNKKVRRYYTCDPKVKVLVGYNRAYGKKARISYIKTTYTPPGIPAPQPPAPPAPPAPPVPTVPAAPDVALVGVTENSITLGWTKPAGDVTDYQFGWWTDETHPAPPWVSPVISASSTPNPYVFTGLDANTVYKVWIRATNNVGPGEKQWLTVRTSAATPPPPTDPIIEERWVEGTPECPLLRVPRYHQKRVLPDGEWVTHHQEYRQAGVADCVNLVEVLPSNVMLPDLRIKNLDKCGKGDLELTGGDCFKVIPSEKYIVDYPHLEGRKLLKFPVLTMNTGDGVVEVLADRAAVEAKDWKAYQTFVTTDGKRVSQVSPQVEFYFAGDGHNHWHFRDFDDYWIETLDGQVQARAEKHGYCVYDNTSYTPFQGKPGVPTTEVYPYASTCGQGLPNALTIIQGLSKGWGDTYPATLPDQALDITGLPNGRYRVGVHADALGAVIEADDSNNTATIEVTIQGDDVVVHPETASGGLA